MGELVRRLDYERRSRHLLPKDAKSRFLTKEYSQPVRAANELAKRMRQRQMRNIQDDIKMFGFKHNDEMDSLQKFKKKLKVKSMKFEKETYERNRTRIGRVTPVPEIQEQKQQVKAILKVVPQNCVLDFAPGNVPVYTSSGRGSRAGTPPVSPASAEFRPRSSRRPQNWSPPRTSDIWRRPPSSRSSGSRIQTTSRPQSSINSSSRPQSFITNPNVYSRPPSFVSVENTVTRPNSFKTVSDTSRPSSFFSNAENSLQRSKTGFSRSFSTTQNRPSTAHSGHRSFQSATVLDSDDEFESDFDFNNNDLYNTGKELKSYRSLKDEYVLKEQQIKDERQELLTLLKLRENLTQRIIEERVKLFRTNSQLPKLKGTEKGVRKQEKQRERVTIPHMPPLI